MELMLPMGLSSMTNRMETWKAMKLMEAWKSKPMDSCYQAAEAMLWSETWTRRNLYETWMVDMVWNMDIGNETWNMRHGTTWNMSIWPVTEWNMKLMKHERMEAII
jgi:hypothetical protein